MSLRQSVKHGIGRLTASAEGRYSQKYLISKSKQQNHFPKLKTATAPAPTSALKLKEALEAAPTLTPTPTPATRLTQVSHKAPTRLVPVGKSSVDRAGAAICALSNYGGGMLQGDSCELHVKVQRDAKLGITTQGASRIYTQRKHGKSNIDANDQNIDNALECHAHMKTTVEENGLLVLAPDPCTLFASSSFSQVQEFEIHSRSSVALIDWYSSGRYRNGEFWDFDKLSTRTSIRFDDEIIPFVQDSICLDFRHHHENGNETKLNENNNYTSTSTPSSSKHPMVVAECHAFASLILYGSQIQQVTERCQKLQDELASKYTRIRQRQRHHNVATTMNYDDDDDDNNDDSISSYGGDDDDLSMLRLAGRVYMGVSQVSLDGSISTSSSSSNVSKNNQGYPSFVNTDDDDDDNNNDGEQSSPSSLSDAYVVRVAATTNEDIYRIFHYCLLPLQSKFGYTFYGDRIRAKTSEIPPKQQQQQQETTMMKKHNDKIKNNMKQNGGNEHPLLPSLEDTKKSSTSTSTLSISSSPAAFWSAFMLADSSMPTGSFAHSGGLEAAVQLGLIQSKLNNKNKNKTKNGNSRNVNNDNDDVTNFVIAATQSSLQMTLPFLMAGLELVQEGQSQNDDDDDDEATKLWLSKWQNLNRQCHAVLASTSPACSASMDQGKSLIRVAIQWLQEEEEEEEGNETNDDDGMSEEERLLKKKKAMILQCLKKQFSSSSSTTPTTSSSSSQRHQSSVNIHHHIGPALGVVTGLLGMNDMEQISRLYAYCVARDIVSAAVRLSIVGPLASVRLLQSVQTSTEESLRVQLHAIYQQRRRQEKQQEKEQQQQQQQKDEVPTFNPMIYAASSTPIIETIHPCHEVLQVRLFRT